MAIATVAILVAIVTIYTIYSQMTITPDQLPPGFIRGNVTILGENETADTTQTFMLTITNTDGWKFATPIFLKGKGGHYTYNESLFPGHFKIDAYNYTSPDLPKRVTIESDRTIVVDLTLTQVTQ